MLTARGHRDIGAASLRWAYAVAGTAWFHLVRLDGLVMDTRFLPGAAEPPQPGGCFVLFVRGELESFGRDARIYEEKTAFALALEHIEGANGRRSFTFRATGRPFVMVQVHAWTSDAPVPSAPKPVPVSERAWSAAIRAAELLEVDEKDPTAPSDELAIALHELVASLADDGLVSAEIAAKARAEPPRPVVLLWNGLRPLIEQMALGSTLDDLSRDASVPKSRARRYVEQMLIGLIGTGFRGLTHHLRLQAAVLMLSADGASIAEVARTVGYGSTAAMARAFRDAGLEAPTTVRDQIART
jgi:AraC-like DNA-binding protein